MGLTKKTASFTVIGVEGDKPTIPEIKSLVESTIIPVIEGTSKKEAYGFCKIYDVFESGMTQGEAAVGFGLRFDTKKISKEMSKKKFREEFAKLKQNAKAERRKISKEEKETLKQSVETDLYMKAKAVEKLIEVVWDTRNNLIYLGTGTKNILIGFIETMMKAFPHLKFTVWSPVAPETKNGEDAKGTPENFQNAFLTWLFYKTKVEKDKMWTLNVKLMNDDANVTIKGDVNISLETYFSIHASRVVDSIEFGYKLDEERKYEVKISRGSWSFKGLKIMPELNFESLDSAIFERSNAFKEFLDAFSKLVKEFEEVRNNDTSNKKFWKNLVELADERIRREFVEA